MSCSYWYCPSSSAALRGLAMENLISNFRVKTIIDLYPAKKMNRRNPPFTTTCCSSTSSSAAPPAGNALPILTKRRRYRKQYPGEQKGITEEMRFVAMRLRNVKGRKVVGSSSSSSSDEESDNDEGVADESVAEEADGGGEAWQPSIEGFVKYLVDSKQIFDTIERIVDESSDVSYAYFRKTGLERSEALSQDLEWFRQQDIVIPLPSEPGLSYAKHIEELAEKSAPAFLCHVYNIYFSHIAGGQVISKQVCDKLLEGRELQCNSWEGNAEELLKGVRENLNMLAEHWSRDEKNKCLREATKSFRFIGQIIRLIIL